jgi:hypothetical protein
MVDSIIDHGDFFECNLPVLKSMVIKITGETHDKSEINMNKIR